MISSMAQILLFMTALLIHGSLFAQTCLPNVPPTAPDSRFSDLQDGTVEDTDTGLIWKKCSEGLSGIDCGNGTATTLSWQAALQYSEDLTYAGSNAWRLPNIKELTSILELSCNGPAINSNFFPNPPSGGFHWTSTPGRSSQTRWEVILFSGLYQTGNAADLNFVHLVRDR